jgi:hypothetical protein
VRDEGKDYGKDEDPDAFLFVFTLFFALVCTARDEGKDYGKDDEGDHEQPILPA